MPSRAILPRPNSTASPRGCCATKSLGRGLSRNWSFSTSENNDALGGLGVVVGLCAVFRLGTVVGDKPRPRCRTYKSITCTP